MDDTQKMLRAVINGQTTLKQELSSEIKKVDQKLDKVERNLTGRIDKIGRQLAYLEDDAPKVISSHILGV